MTHLRFYFTHSLNDLRRNGRRSLFALFCVAAGVAAIVALRTLGLSIGDTLTNNLAAINKGDIKLSAFSSVNTGQSGESRAAFTQSTLDQIKEWAAPRNIQVVTAITNVNISVAATTGTTVGRPQFISSLLIDPAQYPPYGPILALDPPNVPLANLFTGGNDVVVSENLAQQQGIKVGDKVRVGRTDQLFTVRGIAPGDAEGFRSILVLFFGFAYFDQRSASVLQLDTRPDEIYLKIPQGANVSVVAQELSDAVDFNARISTTEGVRATNEQLASIIDRLIVAMGLIALIIGSTGIIHTMLVVVRRRTLEIAVLKTLGVRGRQIAILFLVEAMIMGVVGSAVGLLLGIVISFGVQAFTQQIWPATLRWMIYPDALLTGFGLGVIVTIVFGFLPTFTAAAVRPATVLRPNEARPPTAGLIQTLLALMIVVIGVGLIVGNILGSVAFGLIGVIATLIFMGFGIFLLWLLVLLISVLPSFRSVDLRLALRGIGEHRFRTASTLYALSIGMFALSSITLISSAVPKLLNIGFQSSLGGNVVIFTPLAPIRTLINQRLNTLPGVEKYTQNAIFNAKLISINGDTNWASKVQLDIPFLGNGNSISVGGRRGSFNQSDLVVASFNSVSAQDVNAKGYAGAAVGTGRALSAADAGKAVIVVRESAATRQLGLKPGDKLLYNIAGRQITYELIGLIKEGIATGLNTDLLSGSATVPLDSLPAGATTTFTFTVAQIAPAQLNSALVSISTIPTAFALDVGFIDSLIRKLLNQFTVIPTVVAVLSLFAGAVIIANTVSLATLERRQRIGIMKAIGMTGRRTLWVMVLENGVVGLLGGVIGVGLGILGVALFSAGFGISISESVEWGFVALLMTLALGISLVATLLSAWTAASEKPMNVLRYE